MRGFDLSQNSHLKKSETLLGYPRHYFVIPYGINGRKPQFSTSLDNRTKMNGFQTRENLRGKVRKTSNSGSL